MPENKSHNQRIHAKRRINERFGLHLNRRELAKLISDIQNNKYEFVKRQSNRVSLFKGVIKGMECIIVYDKHRHNIVTFMKPPDNHDN